MSNGKSVVTAPDGTKHAGILCMLPFGMEIKNRMNLLRCPPLFSLRSLPKNVIFYSNLT